MTLLMRMIDCDVAIPDDRIYKAHEIAFVQSQKEYETITTSSGTVLVVEQSHEF